MDGYALDAGVINNPQVESVFHNQFQNIRYHPMFQQPFTLHILQLFTHTVVHVVLEIWSAYHVKWLEHNILFYL
jgi:hypothetical protein